MTSTPRFDAEAIARLHRFGGNALLFELIDLVSSGAPARLAIAREALSAGDAERARGAFHSLKSSAAQLGGVKMQALCERAEQVAGGGDAAAAAALLSELDAECAALLSWLAGVRNGGAR
jgi:HPt (histidine-containing phosphotransfer) domain-containing protein